MLAVYCHIYILYTSLQPGSHCWQFAMTADCTMTVQAKLLDVSFNCHGYHDVLSYIPVLLESADIVLLQEHWLSDSELGKLCFDAHVGHVRLVQEKPAKWPLTSNRANT